MRGQRGDHFRWSLCARSKRAPGTFEAELELIHILHIHVHHLHIYIIHIHIIQIIYIYIYLFTITYLYWFVEMRSPHWGPCFSTCTGGLEGSFHAERVGKGGKGCLVWAHRSPEMPRICTLKQGPWGLLPFCSVKNWGFEKFTKFL